MPLPHNVTLPVVVTVNVLYKLDQYSQYKPGLGARSTGTQFK
jgi:hypothetical protein